MMIEIWKDVLGYEGLYQISNLGNVKSFYKQGKLLKQSLNTPGYKCVMLYKDGRIKNKQVHSLVANAFVNRPESKTRLVVNHIDLDKLNNNATNLEWVTIRENTNKKHLISSSKYTGVSWNSFSCKWQSRIFVDGKNNHLGYFITEYEAYEAYLNAKNEICKLD